MCSWFTNWQWLVGWGFSFFFSLPRHNKQVIWGPGNYSDILSDWCLLFHSLFPINICVAAVCLLLQGQICVCAWPMYRCVYIWTHTSTCLLGRGCTLVFQRDLTSPRNMPSDGRQEAVLCSACHPRPENLNLHLSLLATWFKISLEFLGQVWIRRTPFHPLCWLLSSVFVLELVIIYSG